MPEQTPVYWDFLGAHKPFSGLGSHMRELRKGLELQGLYPICVGESWGAYRALLSLPFSKLTCPHFTSFRIRRREPSKNKIFHSFANMNSDFLFKKEKTLKRVLTVHDVIPLLGSGNTSTLSYLQFKYFLKQALETVDIVLCVSEWTKACLEEKYPQFSDKFLVFPNGFRQAKGQRLLPFEESRSSSLKVVCNARFEPYKNFDLCLQILEADDRLRLRFVTDKRGGEYLSSRCKSTGVRSRLEIFQNLSQESLEKLYQDSDVYLSSSYYEGYGLPPLEAIAFFKPVVFQGGHALDEVLTPEVSLSMSRNSPVMSWVEALWGADALAREEGFAERALVFQKNLPSWEEQAKKLKKLYDTIG